MLDEAVAGGAAVPALELVVVLRTGGRHPPAGAPTAGGRLVSWEEYLGAADRCEPEVAAGRTAAIGPDDLRTWFSPRGRQAPKGAMTTHAQTLRTFATWSEVVGLRAGDRY